MSASLVGSEMCIRDSRTHPSRASGTNFEAIPGPARAGGGLRRTAAPTSLWRIADCTLATPASGARA
eukprot:2107882-Alexandrium_andersonii.AAC.1